MNEIVIYENGNVSLNVTMENETIWLSQKNMVELFGVTLATINEHIENIYKEKELEKNSTIRKFRIVQKEMVCSILEHTTKYDGDDKTRIGKWKVVTNLDFAIFQNHGYKGLYGGLDAKAIHETKGLKKSQKILDFMGSTELAANLFRATQAEEKLKRDNVKTKVKANKTHYDVGKKVRKTIAELGGTMPEDLPTPKENVVKIEKSMKKLESKKS